ncbi:MULTISPECIES: ADP-ribosylglycohydrolase family protein [unclassified Frankia]
MPARGDGQARTRWADPSPPIVFSDGEWQNGSDSAKQAGRRATAKANETTLGELLQGQCQYVVPLYQRPYSWERANLRQLWADITSVAAAGPAATHFLGSLVLAPSPSTTPAGVAIWLVVDGQQRLTALSILLCAIRDHVRDDDQMLAAKIDDLYLMNRYAAGTERYTLLPTRADRTAWTALVERSPEAGGRAGIGDAYQFFRKELAALRDADDPLDAALIEQTMVGQLAIVEIARMSTTTSTASRSTTPAAGSPRRTCCSAGFSIRTGRRTRSCGRPYTGCAGGGADVVRPTVLHVLIAHANDRLDATEAAAALRVVESYLVRRMLVGIASANSNRILMSLVKELGDQTPTAAAITRVLSGPRKKFPTDQLVKEAVLLNPFYWTGRGPQRTYVLRGLEEDYEHLEPVDWGVKLTVEHILPQSLSRPGWKAVLDADAHEGETRDELHRRLVHTLGNLTLTAYNPKLADHEFTEKKKLLADSGLAMNREIAGQDRWGREEIQNRGRALAERIVKIWPGPDESVVPPPQDQRWTLMIRVLAAIPPGRWTSYSDVAEVIGSHAVAVGAKLASARISNAHRVLLLNGSISPDFRWPDPERTDDPREILAAEGVILSRSGRALARQRMTAAELAAAAELEAPEESQGAAAGTKERLLAAPAARSAVGLAVSLWPSERRAAAPTDDANSGLSYQDRVRGCLLGGALGDALGAAIEFQSLDEIRREYGTAGVIGLTAAYGVHAPFTDDTQMTLFTVEGLIRASVRSRSRGIADPPAVLWRAYQRWLTTQRRTGPAAGEMDGWLAAQQLMYARRAPGNACLSGLGRPETGTLARPANPDSKGCGAVMRSAPFGLLQRGPETSFDHAVECAVFTHGHPSGYLAAGAFAWIVAAMVDGASITQATASALGRLSAERDGKEVARALRAALGTAADGAPTAERVESLDAGWVAEEALAIAVYCAVAAPDDPQTALLAAVNHSGDSDSTGAICGNLVGAALGEPALPAAWLKELAGYELVGQVADDLVTEIENTATVSDASGAATPAWSTRYPGS